MGKLAVGWSSHPTSNQVSMWGSDTSEVCRNLLGEELCNRLPRRVGAAIIQSWKVNKNGTVENPLPLMAENHGAHSVSDPDHQH